MRLLFKAALTNRRHLVLLVFTLCAMFALTISSQLEIFGLRVITDKGPDFFELFAPVENGQLQPQEQVTLAEVEERWSRIDVEGDGLIDKESADRYLTQWTGTGAITQAIAWLDAKLLLKQDLSRLALFLVVIALLRAVSLFAHRYTTQLVAIRVSRDLRQSYFEHIQSLPMSFFQKHDVGGLSSRVVGDAQLISEAINAALINYIQMPFTSISTLILCFIASPQLSIILFCALPLVFLPIVYLADRVRKISKRIQKNQEGFAGTLVEFLTGVQTVKIFAMEDFSLRKYTSSNDRMAKLEERNARYDFAARPIIHTVGTLCLSVSIMYGLHVVHMSVSEILFFCGLLYVFYEPIKKFAEENTRIQRGVAAADRMYEVMNQLPLIQDKEGAKEIKEFKDSIEFRDVWFRYNEEHDWILKGLSFKAKKGETVAIVGPTGAGKSTIVQLVPGLYDVAKGEILVDGHGVGEYTQRSLRDLIAFVPQKSFLFLDSIAANIAFGRDYDEKAIRDAAKRAHADEFIQNLPETYDSPVSEGGKNLSGGQQQRLAIARALVKEAPILIMDEATSSLDSVSEAKIKQAIQELHGEITQILIAHRLSTIEHADRIVYLEDGQKIAEGTREELLEICPQFKIMWETMHQSEEASSA